MRPLTKLVLFAAGLGTVFGASMAAGGASEPIGLANAEPAAEHGSQMPDGMVPGLAVAEDEYRLVPAADVFPAGERLAYRFRIEDADGPVTDFDVEHTKRMHVIMVRRDFVGFQHLHPAMQPDGTWSSLVTIPDPGAYRVYADFVVDGEKHTLSTDLFVPGAFDPEPLPQPWRLADAGDGYTVLLTGTPTAGEESTLAFEVFRNGRRVTDIPEYLGARGHLVALRDGDLAYLHVHADEQRLSFDAEFPTPGAYRLFLQFRHRGAVHTAAFTVDVTENAR